MLYSMLMSCLGLRLGGRHIPGLYPHKTDFIINTKHEKSIVHFDYMVTLNFKKTFYTLTKSFCWLKHIHEYFWSHFFSTGLCLFIQSISCQYVLIQEQNTWDEGQAYCRENYNDLATFRNDEDWTNILYPAMTSGAWSGLYNDIDSWRWVYQEENITFSKWNAGQPDNGYGKETCGFIHWSSLWMDTTCNYKYYFVCYNGKK